MVEWKTFLPAFGVIGSIAALYSRKDLFTTISEFLKDLTDFIVEILFALIVNILRIFEGGFTLVKYIVDTFLYVIVHPLHIFIIGEALIISYVVFTRNSWPDRFGGVFEISYVVWSSLIRYFFQLTTYVLSVLLDAVISVASLFKPFG